MQKARMFGNYIDAISRRKGLSVSDLSHTLNCTEHQVHMLLKGRAYASFPQVSALSKLLEVSIDQLLSGDKESYNTTVVHCMNDFQDTSKREEILDLIDDYVDIVDAVTMHQ